MKKLGYLKLWPGLVLPTWEQVQSPDAGGCEHDRIGLWALSATAPTENLQCSLLVVLFAQLVKI